MTSEPLEVVGGIGIAYFHLVEECILLIKQILKFFGLQN